MSNYSIQLVVELIFRNIYIYYIYLEVFRLFSRRGYIVLSSKFGNVSVNKKNKINYKSDLVLD